VSSDPDLLEAFRKQCRHFGPGIAFLAWREQRGVDQDDLIDVMKQVENEQRNEENP
jgi:hypothetical protein